jgi:hypothetical protein
MDTINAIPSGAVLVNTDGSANIDSDTAVYGAYIEYPSNRNRDEIWGPCDGLCNYGS